MQQIVICEPVLGYTKLWQNVRNGIWLHPLFSFVNKWRYMVDNTECSLYSRIEWSWCDIKIWFWLQFKTPILSGAFHLDKLSKWMVSKSCGQNKWDQPRRNDRSTKGQLPNRELVRRKKNSDILSVNCKFNSCNKFEIHKWECSGFQSIISPR